MAGIDGQAQIDSLLQSSRLKILASLEYSKEFDQHPHFGPELRQGRVLPDLGKVASAIGASRVFLYAENTTNSEQEIDINSLNFLPEINLPFSICLFEIAGKNIIGKVPIPKGSGPGGFFHVSSILAIEINPRKFQYFCGLISEKGSRPVFILEFREEENVKPGTDGRYYISHMVAGLLRYLDKSIFAEETINQKFKIKTRAGTEFHKIRRVVHVRPKSATPAVVRGLNGAPLEWTHTWEVRGHWRKVVGVGKDRDGNYTVFERTWVLPHVKGDGPLVVKNRII